MTVEKVFGFGSRGEPFSRPLSEGNSLKKNSMDKIARAIDSKHKDKGTVRQSAKSERFLGQLSPPRKKFKRPFLRKYGS